MRKLLLCVMAAIMFVACGKDDFSFNVKEEIKNPYAVTPEEAVQLLQTVIGDETTRSVSISDVQTLTKGNFTQTTRSGADDEVIYIVDIEGGGSAIMGADKRMEPIYAVLDNTKITAEQLVGATTRSESEGEDIEDYVLGLLNNAILCDIQEVETAGIEMPIIPRDYTWSVTTITAQQEKLLKTAWHQSSPFNNNYPICTNTGERYAAGCGPIALAQILYYNRFPNSINGVAFDWDLIEEYEEGNLNHSNSATIEVANFVYKIKEASGASYASNGATGLNISDARNFMRNVGYNNTSVVDYSLIDVMTMVYARKLPVYIRGTNQYNSSDRHAWVIDGCNVYKIDHWVRHYSDAVNYTEYIENTVNTNLVHCNFGWQNKNLNGDYTSNVFTPATNVHYNGDLKLIMYSK